MSFAALPPDYSDRALLHNEIHARPSMRVRLPVFMVYVAVLNHDIPLHTEWQHLRLLPMQEQLTADDLQAQFLRLRWDNCLLRWERHTEFTRYTLVQPLTHDQTPQDLSHGLLETLQLPDGWMARIPGTTLLAMQLLMLPSPLDNCEYALKCAQPWFGKRTVVASRIGNNDNAQAHSIVMSDLRLCDNGWSHMLVLSDPAISATRAGRVAQRILEIETYRLLALLALPVAKNLMASLQYAEHTLADTIQSLSQPVQGEQALADKAVLDKLVSLAIHVEQERAQYGFRFAASRAYTKIVQQRLAELRERQIDGTQTLGEFLQRRFVPAIATVDAAANRLEQVSSRIDRASDLLRTRVTIATEAQNHALLNKLNQGQHLQLKLQSTVEGLSIAAISYYVVSLILYASKALKNLGLPLYPEMIAGLSIPLVLFVVWRIVQHIHKKLHA